MCREWLSGRQRFTGHTLLRDGPFLYRPQRLTSLTVQGKGHAHFADLYHRRHALAINGEINQGRLGGCVVVPHIVVHQLVMPHHFTGIAIECNHRAGVVVQAIAMTAIVIWLGVARGQEHQVALFVHGQNRPHIGGACYPGAVFTALRHARRHRVPCPCPLACSRIVGMHDTTGGICAQIIEHVRAGDDFVAQDRGRRGNAKFTRVVFGLPLAGIYLAIVAKIGATLASACIQRDQACIQRAHHNAVFTVTGLTGLPATHPSAVGENLRAVVVHIGLKAPALLAGTRIQSKHVIKR